MDGSKLGVGESGSKGVVKSEFEGVGDSELTEMDVTTSPDPRGGRGGGLEYSRVDDLLGRRGGSGGPLVEDDAPASADGGEVTGSERS